MHKKFLLPLINIIRADLFLSSLAVWNSRGGAAHFCPAPPKPRLARRVQNSVRAISKINRQKGFCKRKLSASLRSAANLYGIFGEKEMHLSIRAKEIFS
jgi:hypothetical protein